MTTEVPLVDYLVLGDRPHLMANECTHCSAKFFDRRNACGRCGALSFTKVEVPTEGVLRSFTIVSFAAPGVPVPFIAGVIDCETMSLRANVVNVRPDPEVVKVGMKLRLSTFPIGSDSAGTEAIGFGFEPVTPTVAEEHHHHA